MRGTSTLQACPRSVRLSRSTKAATVALPSQSAMPSQRKQEDENWPSFHVQPRSGWVNDPNGPLTHNGQHHIFYQHIPDKAHWDWGMKWGHCVSSDMIHWRHLGVALAPTKRSSDSCGCWSGCVTVDHDGMPSAIYTGVRLKGSEYDGPQQRDYAPGEPMTEAVLLARCIDSDGDLATWGPGHTVIADPPDFGCPLEGWRDPFLFQGGAKGERWQMVMATGKCRNGVKDGTVLLYSADRLEGPWRYDGILFEGDCRAGRVAECPGLVQIYQKGSGATREVSPVVTRQSTATRTTFVRTASRDEGHVGKHLLAFGAYEATKQNESWDWDPNIYYIGDFDGEKFHPDCEPGNVPRRLDIGDAPYAPNFQIDVHGRLFVWVWLRDPRPDSIPQADYCGCLGIPRLMSYLPACASSASRDSLLYQEPIPEFAALREGLLWELERDNSRAVNSAVKVPGVSGSHWECNISLQRKGAKHSCVAVTSSTGFDSILLAISWDTDEFVWVKGPEGALLGADTLTEALVAGNRSMTGPLGLAEARAAGVAVADSVVAKDKDEMTLRVFVDGSAVEVFTGTGQVASTRLYCAPNGIRQLWAVSLEGEMTMHGQAWEMGTIWRTPEGTATDPALVM